MGSACLSPLSYFQDILKGGAIFREKTLVTSVDMSLDVWRLHSWVKSGKTFRFRRSSADSSRFCPVSPTSFPHLGEEVGVTEVCVGGRGGVGSRVFLPPIAHANSNHDGLYSVDSAVFRCV